MFGIMLHLHERRYIGEGIWELGGTWEEVHGRRCMGGGAWEEVHGRRCMGGGAWGKVHGGGAWEGVHGGGAWEEVHGRRCMGGGEVHGGTRGELDK